MRRNLVWLALSVLMVSVLLLFYSNREIAVPEHLQSIRDYSERLAPLHSKLGKPRPGDWLLSHDEKGQTFAQYLRIDPVRLAADQDVLYVLPLGDFDDRQRQIVDLSAEFLGIYFCCEVKMLDTLTLDDAIPADARRVHPSWGVKQILSTYVLEDVLKPRLPDDGVALIAFTTSDLYPADDWNFVFGQASLRQRVGVWSIFRNGDPEAEFQTCLRRTLKTATHETGHMFSIRHCIAYECNMCGSNNRQESDRHPIHMCPECIAKVWYATDCDPIDRFRRLKAFYEKHQFADEAAFVQRSVQRLE